MQIEDEPGLLSDVLQVIAQFGANILTIHQSIPINGVATLSISVQVLQTTKDISEMLDAMEKRTGVHSVKFWRKNRKRRTAKHGKSSDIRIWYSGKRRG